MKCDQDLWYDHKKLIWEDELNPRVCCAFGNVLNLICKIQFGWSAYFLFGTEQEGLFIKKKIKINNINFYINININIININNYKDL